MTATLPVLAAVVAAAGGWPASAVSYHRYCTRMPAIGPPITALAIAMLAFAAADRLHPALVATAGCWLVFVGTPLTVIDAVQRRLPDMLTGATFAGTAVLLTGAAAMSGRWQDLARAGAGALAVAAFFVILALARPGSAGLGDAKFGLSVALLAAWFGWGVMLAAALAACALAACYGLWLIATGRASLRGGSVPFGPFLLAGCLLVVLLAR